MDAHRILRPGWLLMAEIVVRTNEGEEICSWTVNEDDLEDWYQPGRLQLSLAFPGILAAVADAIDKDLKL